MGDDMGAFRVTVEIENPARPGERRALESVLVDTGAELSWFPAALLDLIGLAVMGQNLILNMNDHGFTVVAFNRTISKVDEFLAHEAKGTKIIGAHSLEGLNLRIDPVNKQLIDAGPAPAAVTRAA